MKATTRTHRGVVKVFPMASPWHYVVIPKEKYVGFGTIRAFGMMPIIATVGNTTWKTALLPLGKCGGESQFFIAIKAQVRKQEGVREGDTIAISFVPDTVRIRHERKR